MHLDHKKYNVPGILLAISEEGGRIKHYFSGLANLKPKTDMQPKGLFRAGFITRIFTASLLMRLVDEHALNLDEPIDAIARANQQDYGLLKLMVNQYPFLKPITVRELLTNTSGLPAFEKTAAYNEIFIKKPRKIWQVENYLDAISGIEVRYQRGYEPGSRGYFSNSKTNYVVAGLVLEAVSGIETSAAMRELFTEFGLSNSHYLSYGEMNPKLMPKMIHGYLPVSHPFAMAFNRQKELTYNKSKELRVYDVTDAYTVNGMGNAALVSSADDLIRFLQKLMNAEVVVNNYKEMFASVKIPSMYTDVEDSYCMGFYKTYYKHYGEIIWAAGNSLGYGVLLVHALNKEKTFLLMVNANREFMSLHCDSLVTDVLQQLL